MVKVQILQFLNNIVKRRIQSSKWKQLPALWVEPAPNLFSEMFDLAHVVLQHLDLQNNVFINAYLLAYSWRILRIA